MPVALVLNEVFVREKLGVPMTGSRSSVSWMLTAPVASIDCSETTWTGATVSKDDDWIREPVTTIGCGASATVASVSASCAMTGWARSAMPSAVGAAASLSLLCIFMC